MQLENANINLDYSSPQAPEQDASIYSNHVYCSMTTGRRNGEKCSFNTLLRNSKNVRFSESAEISVATELSPASSLLE